jgi:uncharacterized RDD family membrane protein YckC
MIEDYLQRFDRWTAGTPEHRRRLHAELEAHLRDAERAGELDGALARLGTPRQAAGAFARGRPFRPASLPERAAAAAFDALTVFALFLAAYLISQRASVGGPGQGMVDALTIAGYAWWGIGLPLVEWLSGRTPGKALVGLRVVTDDGTAPSLAQVALRRSTLFFLMAPFGVVDCAFALRDQERRRAVDVAAGTVVVSDGHAVTSAGVAA